MTDHGCCMSTPLAAERPSQAQSTLFRIGYHWTRPFPRPWFDSYDPAIPLAIDFERLRVEQLLERAARRFPNQLALAYFESRWTYSELLERVKKIAGEFRQAGVKPKDRVLFVLPNCPEFIVSWFAVHWLGAEVVPCNPLASGLDLARIAEKTNAKLVLGLDLRLAPVLEMTRRRPTPVIHVVSLSDHLPIHLKVAYRLGTMGQRKPKPAPGTKLVAFRNFWKGSAAPINEPAITDPTQIAVLQPTGGTTGVPKLAMLTHENLVGNLSQYFSLVDRPPATDRVLAVLPFFHIYGATVVMLSAIAHANTLYLMARFDLNQFFRLAQRERLTIIPMVPFMFIEILERLNKKTISLRGFEICSSGSDALDASVIQRWAEVTGVQIIEGYGLSECSPVVTSNMIGLSRPGTVGVPIPSTDVKIVDVETGTREMPIGDVGELVVQGPQVMKGYLDNPSETAIALRDGWFHTGDLATMDQEGYFRIVDRKKDMIISGGLNIFPSEIEAVIEERPDVKQCAVVGEADAKWGQRVIAYVTPAPGQAIDVEQLRAHCRASLAAYKAPREFRVCEALPVSFLGKVRRAELRQTVPQPATEDESNASSS